MSYPDTHGMESLDQIQRLFNCQFSNLLTTRQFKQNNSKTNETFGANIHDQPIINLPIQDVLLGCNFAEELRKSRGLGDDGGKCPTVVEATPWSRASSIQCVDLPVRCHIAAGLNSNARALTWHQISLLLSETKLVPYTV